MEIRTIDGLLVSKENTEGTLELPILHLNRLPVRADVEQFENALVFVSEAPYLKVTPSPVDLSIELGLKRQLYTHSNGRWVFEDIRSVTTVINDKPFDIADPAKGYLTITNVTAGGGVTMKVGETYSGNISMAVEINNKLLDDAVIAETRLPLPFGFYNLQIILRVVDTGEEVIVPIVFEHAQKLTVNEQEQELRLFMWRLDKSVDSPTRPGGTETWPIEEDYADWTRSQNVVEELRVLRNKEWQFIGFEDIDHIFEIGRLSGVRPATTQISLRNDYTTDKLNEEESYSFYAVSGIYRVKIVIRIAMNGHISRSPSTVFIPTPLNVNTLPQTFEIYVNRLGYVLRKKPIIYDIGSHASNVNTVTVPSTMNNSGDALDTIKTRIIINYSRTDYLDDNNVWQPTYNTQESNIYDSTENNDFKVKNINYRDYFTVIVLTNDIFTEGAAGRRAFRIAYDFTLNPPNTAPADLTRTVVNYNTLREFTVTHAANTDRAPYWQISQTKWQSITDTDGSDGIINFNRTPDMFRMYAEVNAAQSLNDTGLSSTDNQADNITAPSSNSLPTLTASDNSNKYLRITDDNGKSIQIKPYYRWNSTGTGLELVGTKIFDIATEIRHEHFARLTTPILIDEYDYKDIIMSYSNYLTKETSNNTNVILPVFPAEGTFTLQKIDSVTPITLWWQEEDGVAPLKNDKYDSAHEVTWMDSTGAEFTQTGTNANAPALLPLSYFYRNNPPTSNITTNERIIFNDYPFLSLVYITRPTAVDGEENSPMLRFHAFRITLDTVDFETWYNDPAQEEYRAEHTLQGYHEFILDMYSHVPDSAQNEIIYNKVTGNTPHKYDAYADGDFIGERDITLQLIVRVQYDSTDKLEYTNLLSEADPDAGELRLAYTPMTSDTQFTTDGNQIVISSGVYSGAAYYAFKSGDPNSQYGPDGWVSNDVGNNGGSGSGNSDGNVVNNPFLQIKLSKAKKVVKFKIHNCRNRPDNYYFSFTSRPPTKFEVLGKNVGTDWVSLGEFNVPGGWSMSSSSTFDEPKEFTIANPDKYLYYKLVCLERADASERYLISRWRLTEEIPATIDNPFRRQIGNEYFDEYTFNTPIVIRGGLFLIYNANYLPDGVETPTPIAIYTKLEGAEYTDDAIIPSNYRFASSTSNGMNTSSNMNSGVSADVKDWFGRTGNYWQQLHTISGEGTAMTAGTNDSISWNWYGSIALNSPMPPGFDNVKQNSWHTPMNLYWSCQPRLCNKICVRHNPNQQIQKIEFYQYDPLITRIKSKNRTNQTWATNEAEPLNDYMYMDIFNYRYFKLQSTLANENTKIEDILDTLVKYDSTDVRASNYFDTINRIKYTYRILQQDSGSNITLARSDPNVLFFINLTSYTPKSLKYNGNGKDSIVSVTGEKSLNKFIGYKYYNIVGKPDADTFSNAILIEKADRELTAVNEVSPDITTVTLGNMSGYFGDIYRTEIKDSETWLADPTVLTELMLKLKAEFGVTDDITYVVNDTVSEPNIIDGCVLQYKESEDEWTNLGKTIVFPFTAAGFVDSANPTDDQLNAALRYWLNLKSTSSIEDRRSRAKNAAIHSRLTRKRYKFAGDLDTSGNPQGTWAHLEEIKFVLQPKGFEKFIPETNFITLRVSSAGIINCYDQNFSQSIAFSDIMFFQSFNNKHIIKLSCRQIFKDKNKVMSIDFWTDKTKPLISVRKDDCTVPDHGDYQVELRQQFATQAENKIKLRRTMSFNNLNYLDTTNAGDTTQGLPPDKIEIDTPKNDSGSGYSSGPAANKLEIVKPDGLQLYAIGDYDNNTDVSKYATMPPAIPFMSQGAYAPNMI